MATQQKYTKHILSFLEARDYINLSQLERRIGCPRGMFGQAKLGRLIPERWIFPVLFELAKCGIKDIYGHTLTAHDDTFCITGKKQLEDLRAIEILHLKDGTDHRRPITEEMEVMVQDENGMLYNPFYDTDPFRGQTKGTSYEYEVLEQRVLYTNYEDL